MQLCHTPAALSAVFDEPNLIACAGLVPSVALADRIGLLDLADQWLTVPGSRGTAGAKVMSLVAGMLATPTARTPQPTRQTQDHHPRPSGRDARARAR